MRGRGMTTRFPPGRENCCKHVHELAPEPRRPRGPAQAGRAQGHTAAHPAQGQVSPLTDGGGDGIGQPVDHEHLREPHRTGLNFFGAHRRQPHMQADVGIAPEGRVFVGDGDAGGLVVFRQLQAFL